MSKPDNPPNNSERDSASHPRLVRCTLCGDESEECKYLPIYVIGSEGAECCLQCRIILTDTAKGIMRVAATARKAGFKAAKKVAESKATNREFQ